MVEDLLLRMARPTEGVPGDYKPQTFGNDIPVRLQPGDPERFEVVNPLVFGRLRRKGSKGRQDLIAMAVDGLGNRYESKPFRVDIGGEPRTRSSLQ